MNVRNSTTCVSLHEKLTNRQLKLKWNNINWEKVEKQINRLQTRITKAVIEKKWYLVKRLQYLLTHSYYAKLLAVRRVIQNKGKRTAGIDNKKWKSSEEKMKAVLSLTDTGYKARSLKRVYIEKYGKKKKRPLGIPTLHDRAMQALYALALEPVAETTADKTSFGFRKYRSTHDAMQQIFIVMARKNSAQWVLEGDIKGCFDNIKHRWLLENIPIDKKILKQFLKAGYIYKRKLFPTESGTPQGGIISPILANMVLDGLEKVIKKKYWTNKKGTTNINYNKHKINYVRYADDFIVTSDSKEKAEEIKEIIKDYLQERGLELSEEKALITHINNGFDFLGWNFRKYNKKLLIKPSPKSIKKVTEKISNIIKEGKTWKQENLIDSINPIITGWSNYHQSVVSKKIFNKLDKDTWNMLWKWAKRRHPNNKSRNWVMNRYWHKIGNRSWCFKSDRNRLKLFRDKKIIRHVPLKLTKNPYLDKDYFEQRKFKQGIKKLTGKFKTIWKNQNGKCYFCKQSLDIAEERDLHRIIPQKEGGEYTIANSRYTHAYCHWEYHAKLNTVLE